MFLIEMRDMKGRKNVAQRLFTVQNLVFIFITLFSKPCCNSKQCRCGFTVKFTKSGIFCKAAPLYYPTRSRSLQRCVWNSHHVLLLHSIVSANCYETLKEMSNVYEKAYHLIKPSVAYTSSVLV